MHWDLLLRNGVIQTKKIIKKGAAGFGRNLFTRDRQAEIEWEARLANIRDSIGQVWDGDLGAWIPSCALGKHLAPCV